MTLFFEIEIVKVYVYYAVVSYLKILKLWVLASFLSLQVKAHVNRKFHFNQFLPGLLERLGK